MCQLCHSTRKQHSPNPLTITLSGVEIITQYLLFKTNLVIHNPLLPFQRSTLSPHPSPLPSPHLAEGELGDDRVLGERGAAHEVEHRLALAGEPGGAVRHHTGAL